MSDSTPLSRREKIDLGLAVIAATRKPTESMNLSDIAEVCGVSPQAIWQIERKALAKMRARARRLGLEK